MRNNRISTGILALFILLFATSCEKWMDVQPRTKIKSEVLLNDEQGYKDALIGCYSLMKVQSLYGRELTFGFMDALAQQYDTGSNTSYKELNVGLGTFNLKSTANRGFSNNIWNGMYNVVANVNNILDNIDNDKALFTGDNYGIIKGEALAMRAYIHLDLLRLFGSTDLTQMAIPYVNKLSTDITPRSTGTQVMGLILKDLEDAAVNLSVDPIIKGNKKSSSDFLNNRHQRLNYYAVKGIQARAYLWNNDKVNALTCATEVITVGDQIFPWIKTANLTGSDATKDYTYSTENLFALNVFDLKTIGNTWFYAASAQQQLWRNTNTYKDVFETVVSANVPVAVGVSDYRFLYGFKASGSNSINYKFYQADNYNPSFAAMIPLVRRSEMYYIAAECNVGVDNLQALARLNDVRRNRGIATDLTMTLYNGNPRTEADINKEILKEYRKEFQGEGQFFAYCKRTKQTNYPSPNNTTSLTNAHLVLPLPDSEVEFGR